MSENEPDKEPDAPAAEEAAPTPEATPQPAPGGPKPEGAEKKILCGILAIVLGQLGVHKFILGYNTEGIIMAAVTVVGYILSAFCIGLLGPLAMGVIGLVEGIIYLTKTDEEFVNTYVTGKKPWF